MWVIVFAVRGGYILTAPDKDVGAGKSAKKR